MDNNNWEFIKACRVLLKKPKVECKSEERFEDDPRAINEQEVGKVSKQSVGYVYSESSMADIIIETKK